MANATFFNPPQGDDSLFGNSSAFSWSREGSHPEARFPLLEALLSFQPPQHSIWGQWGHHEPNILPKLIIGIAMLFQHIDFDNPHHGWTMPNCETTEVPVPAALPLFSLALVSLGMFKRRSKTV
jgi:hypothetical protein